jgi:hypothetical protein
MFLEPLRDLLRKHVARVVHRAQQSGDLPRVGPYALDGADQIGQTL